jgi:hypothetical protein
MYYVVYDAKTLHFVEFYVDKCNAKATHFVEFECQSIKVNVMLKHYILWIFLHDQLKINAVRATGKGRIPHFVMLNYTNVNTA